MAESYKLTYFNLKAVGEPIRLIFAFAGVQYEDNRIAHENWPEIKKNFPYGQLPVLQVGDKVLAQSNTICRFLARKFNLVGTNDWEAAKLDELADAIADFRKEWDPVHHEQDPAKKTEQKKKFVEAAVPKYFVKLDALIASNQGPYLLGKNVSWVDLLLAHYLETFGILLTDFPGYLDAYPNMKKLRDSVFAIPQIKAWVDKRPQTMI